MIYFTSDQHFDHGNIIKYCHRPFSSIEAMNQEMVYRWNSVVTNADRVYHLGDFSLSKKSVAKYLPLLNGEKHLIMGNHDSCHPLHKKKAEVNRELYFSSGFKSIELYNELNIAGQKVQLSHMPFHSNSTDDIYDLHYSQYRPKDEDQWLIHGHVHLKWKVCDRMINVGVDVWDFYPVPISEIEQIIKKSA